MNRRNFLQLVAAAPLGPRAARATPSKPNIVIMVADDLGHGDLGVTGARDIRTPNLDRMAGDGMRFTHAYANAPVCTPTRVALLTGRYQQRSGLSRVIYVNERELGLALGALLIPEVLKPHGYATALAGKWHLGYPKKYFPTRQGFDEFAGHLAGNVDYFAHTDRLGDADLWRNEEAWEDPRYMTRLIAEESIRFIDRHADDPFFLYVPFNAPHDPFQGPEDRHTAGNQEITRRKNRTRAVYKSMVESMDFQAGRILEHLKKRNLEENTAVFFMSDNGGLPVVASNAPFRGFKTTLWEGGIRTPLIARWKGQFPAGKTSSEMAAGMDLFPTSLAIAGAGVPSGHKLDGVSLLDICRGKGALNRDSLFFNYKDPSNKVAQRAFVRDRWKYLRDKEGAEYLFHLSEDIGESNDLSGKQPDRLAVMKRRYEAWLEDVRRGAPPEPPRRRLR
jgi:arylsulfatase A-like enzyme